MCFQLVVDVSWILMSTESEPNECEVEHGTKQLASKGKKKVICIKIPTIIRNKPKQKPTTETTENKGQEETEATTSTTGETTTKKPKETTEDKGPKETEATTPTTGKTTPKKPKEATEPADSGGSPANIDGQPLTALAAIILVYIHGRGQTFFL